MAQSKFELIVSDEMYKSSFLHLPVSLAKIGGIPFTRTFTPNIRQFLRPFLDIHSDTESHLISVSSKTSTLLSCLDTYTSLLLTPAWRKAKAQ
jgi:hypothetical protein